jgi:DNA-binding transcriptional regulator YhcF (GntR family)
MYYLKIDSQKKIPKYLQVVDGITTDIEKKILKENEQLPSLHELSNLCNLSRDTVEKAYKILKNRGVITVVRGKGFYVKSKQSGKIQILLVLNKLSSYKKRIYYSFLKTLRDEAVVELQIHHYNPQIFKEIIERSQSHYDYYVVFPIFSTNEDEDKAIKILEEIPSNKLILLDRNLPQFKSDCLAIFQDFEQDTYKVLNEVKQQLLKYEHFYLVFPNENICHAEIIKGVWEFCKNNNKRFTFKENIGDEMLQSKTFYLVIEETDLADLIKKIRVSGFTLGENIGIISFNDTTLKELLDITVITTDFEAMGATAARMLLNKQQAKIKNPFFVIQRGSL